MEKNNPGLSSQLMAITVAIVFATSLLVMFSNNHWFWLFILVWILALMARGMCFMASGDEEQIIMNKHITRCTEPATHRFQWPDDVEPTFQCEHHAKESLKMAHMCRIELKLEEMPPLNDLGCKYNKKLKIDRIRCQYVPNGGHHRAIGVHDTAPIENK